MTESDLLFTKSEYLFFDLRNMFRDHQNISPKAVFLEKSGQILTVKRGAYILETINDFLKISSES